MPVWKEKTESFCGLFLLVFTPPVVLLCCCHVEAAITSVLDAGAQAVPSFQAASGHVCCVRVPCPGSCLCGGSGPSLTRGWSSGWSHHILVFCIFSSWYLPGFRPDPLALLLAPGNCTLNAVAHLGLLQVTATHWQWQIKLPSVPCYNFQLIINMLKMWQAWLMPLSTSDLGIRFHLAQRDVDLWGFCNHLSS